MQYAHELRHYCQGLDTNLARPIKSFLDSKKRKGWVPHFKAEKDASEFDADESACRCFVNIHGSQALKDFVSIEAALDPSKGQYYERLFALSHERQSVTNGNA
jgi:hypothetical protein